MNPKFDSNKTVIILHCVYIFQPGKRYWGSVCDSVISCPLQWSDRLKRYRLIYSRPPWEKTKIRGRRFFVSYLTIRRLWSRLEFSHMQIQIQKKELNTLHSVDHPIWVGLGQVIGSIIWDSTIQNSTKRNTKCKWMLSLLSCPSVLGRVIAVFASTQSQQVGDGF